MVARYEENQAGMAQLARAPFLIAHMGDRAQAIATYAEQVTSPVDTGRYSGQNESTPKPGGFHVIVGVRDGHAWAQVYNPTPYAVYLEFGTRYMARQRPLGRAIQAARD